MSVSLFVIDYTSCSSVVLYGNISNQSMALSSLTIGLVKPQRVAQSKKIKGPISMHINAATSAEKKPSEKTIRRTLKAGVLSNIKALLQSHPDCAIQPMVPMPFDFHSNVSKIHDSQPRFRLRYETGILRHRKTDH